MKTITLFIINFFWLVSFCFGQDLNSSQNVKSINTIYQLSAGVNTVNNLGLRSPLTSPSDWGFSTPFSFGIEARSYINSDLAFTMDAGFNKIEESTYYSLDGSIKYYLNEWIPLESFEFFVNGGLGVFNIDRTDVSANVGGGVQYWFNDKFGVRLRSLGKFAFSAKENLINNNHFQHILEFVIVL
jgi:hypothetical protein